ncbi:hypothetical protein B0J11DRAFT_612756 [Dendryphion nanum]|uniref:MYND-type domain-containing protein n=1 Tax=Dendryphion nanum TaxID=256645 RepID=A0A9P9E2V2_9PLEO|nr:hypothetical protein B0J11DRAFT_612756 [Dendryphion nanum]
MFRPVYIDIVSFFYPIGNTPAVCLTQNLSRESSGNILLLGCGDVRSVLFTLQSEQNNPRALDITCCDLQAAVLARNILLFTLALDDTKGAKQQLIWNIYYHFNLDATSLDLLTTQAKKLSSLYHTLQDWQSSTYGRTLRFCDSSTFVRIQALWISYSGQSVGASENNRFSQLLESNLKRAKEIKEYHYGSGVLVSTGRRSAAPLGISFAELTHEAYSHYWEHGSTSHDSILLKKTTHPNPLFAYLGTDSWTLHYGTDPLLGFHLAPAFAAQVGKSPPVVRWGTATKAARITKVVEVAQAQFRDWCANFRVAVAKKDLTIRMFAGDALAFAHSLHHAVLTETNQPTNIRRDTYHLENIHLDGADYRGSASKNKAPLSFTVIDTSNLIDHIGPVNLLTAVSPLLDDDDVSSYLYTESLVKRESSHKAYIDDLLSGDFPTMSLLLDLTPVEYWTNASTSSSADEAMFDTALRLFVERGEEGQMPVSLTWKRPLPRFQSTNLHVIEPRLKFDTIDLAHVLFGVYRKMFQNENMASLLSEISILKLSRNSILYYARGSFAIFLYQVRRRAIVDWNNLMAATLGLIENDSTIMMGRNYIQELYLSLHLLGLYSVETLLNPNVVLHQNQDGIRKWTDLPGVVCISVKVPRKALSALTGPKPMDIGTPIAQCVVQSSSRFRGGRWQNIFSAIHIAFGKISTSGSRHSNQFTVQIEEDELRWKGTSPLIVSFNVPSWFLLLEPQNAAVVFGLQSTPFSAKAFIHSLGFELKIYETTLGNEEDVYVTSLPPHLTSMTSVHCSGNLKETLPELSNAESSSSITANVSQSEGRITSITNRADLISDRLKDILRGGCVVRTTQAASCDFTLTFGNTKASVPSIFPLPVDGSKIRTRIARKSSYVEIEALIDMTSWTRFPGLTFSRHMDSMNAVLTNMHVLNMDLLPVLDPTRHSELQWLITHTSGMFSGRERKLREQKTSNDARVSLKDSLFSLFMHFTGLQGAQSRVFGLHIPDGGGTQILIFVSCMRLDLGSQTVVLDCAALPLTQSLASKIRNFLVRITEMGICNIMVDEEELNLWKQVFPSLAERCRSWRHGSSCEYARGTNQQGVNFLCSCGHGILPDKFITGIPNFSQVIRYTTRVAISPIFSVPIADAPFDGATETASFSSATCRGCGISEAANGKALLKCSRCLIAKYCSVKCQRADWKQHKHSCSVKKIS